MLATDAAARGHGRAPASTPDALRGTVTGAPHAGGQPSGAAASPAGAGEHAFAAEGGAAPPRLADDVPGWLAARLREDAAREAKYQRQRLLTRRVLAWGGAAVVLALVALGASWLYEEHRVDGALVVVATTSPAAARSVPGAAPAGDPENLAHGVLPAPAGSTQAGNADNPPLDVPADPAVGARSGGAANVQAGVPAAPAAGAQVADPASDPRQVKPAVAAPPEVSAHVADTKAVKAPPDAGRAAVEPVPIRAAPVEKSLRTGAFETAGVTPRAPSREPRTPKSKRQPSARHMAADEEDATPPAEARSQHKHAPRHAPAESRAHKADAAAARGDGDNDAEPTPARRREETLMQCRVLGYDERQCLRHGCEMTRFGLACRG